MKKISLVIMAAGIGSRFGGGIKQLEPVGPSGEIIMDYSIHDAIKAVLVPVLAVVSNSWSRLMSRVILSWIIRFMMRSKLVLTRWFLLSERILKQIFVRL